jgi:lipopolysaccharide transport system ATP-binding protein
VRGRVGTLIALGAGFNPLLTGRENVFVNAAILGFNRAETMARFDAIVGFAEVHDFIDAPLQSYSSGMQARLGFAVAAQLEPDILLVDEILAVGDIAFRAKCYRRIDELMRQGTAVVLVSHQANTLLSVCKKAVLLDRGRAVAAGEISEVLRGYEERLAPQEVAEGTQPTRRDHAPSELRITGVTLCGADGQPASSLQTNLPGAFRIMCEASRAFERVGAGLIIRRLAAEGEPLLHLDGCRDGLWLSIPQGTNQLTFHMAHVGLMPGTYRAKVFVARTSLHLLDIIDTFTFKVSSHHSFGSAEFQQAGRWEVTRREPSDGS